MNRFLIALLATASFAANLPVATAQNLFQQPGNESEGVFLLAPRPLMRLLREGERAIAQERYADAIAALRELFDENAQGLPEDLRGQDFFVERGARGLYSKTLKGEAVRLLGSMKEEGQDLLEIEFGVAAEKLLREGVAERDFDAIYTVARKYPFTVAGLDAQALIARKRMTEGEPLAAAALFQTLLDLPGARQRFGPELAKAAALCWMKAGLQDAAVSSLEISSESFLGQSFELAGQQVAIEADSDWRSIVANALEFDRTAALTPSTENWYRTGGLPARNAVSELSLPLNSARWVTKTHGSVPEERALNDFAATQQQGDNVILPKSELRMIGDLVLAKTTDSEILGVDFESGLTRWAFYKNSAPAKLMTHNFSQLGTAGASRLSEELKSRVWGSSAYGKFSCDSERLYYITEGVSSQSNNPRQTFVASSVTNQLQIASILGEGKILTILGGDVESTPANDLSGAYFLGPPISYEGDLYAIIEINAETRLVVVDPETGELLWSQQLCHPQARPLATDQLRQSQALSPSISDGIVLCPTGVGAIVGVDLISRSLRWGFAYGKNVTQSANQFNLPGRGGAFGFGSGELDLGPRWHENGLIVQDGLLVFTPVEEDNYYVRNVLTGQQMVAPKSRDSARYIAGVRNSRLYIVSDERVHCFAVDSQTNIWERPFPDRAKLAGKGLWMEDSLLIPLTGNRLVEINAKDGTILGEATVDQPLGNLFAHRGNLISVSATAVSTFYTRDRLTDSVEERLAENANDVWALKQKSQLALVSGDIDTAFSNLEEAYAIDETDVETRTLLIETLLAGLEADFDKYEERAVGLRDIAQDSPQRSRFLQWLAMGSIRAGDQLKAFYDLIAFMDERWENLNRSSLQLENEMRLSALHTVATDAWIATELARCYRLASVNERAEMVEAIDNKLAPVSGMVLSQRRQKLQFFAWHPAAEEKLLSAGIALAEDDVQKTIAEQTLLPLLYSENEATAEVANKLLAQRTSDDVLKFGPQGMAFQSLYQRDNEVPTDDFGSNTASAMEPIEWKRGKVSLVSLRKGQRYPNGLALPTQAERFGRPEFVAKLAGNVVVLENMNGEPVGRCEYNQGSAQSTNEFNSAIVRGGLLIIETSSEVVGMDIYRGLANPQDALLWRQSLMHKSAGPGQQLRRARSQQVSPALGVEMPEREGTQGVTRVGPLTAAGLLIQMGTELMCIDAYSGRQQWSVDGYDSEIRVASDGLEIAVVNPAMGMTEILDCRDGSKLRREKYEGDWQNWYSYGPWLVDYRDVAGEVNAGIRSGDTRRPIVRVWNPFSSEEIGLLDLKRDSRANHAEGKHLVVADQEDKLHYFDLENGKSYEWEVPIDRKLQKIFVQRFDGLLVVMSQVDEALGRNPSSEAVMQRVDGRVYAIDIGEIDEGTAKLAWERPGYLRAMDFSVSQPRNSPFMAVYRHVDRRSQEVSPFGLIDLRTGKLVHAATDLDYEIPTGLTMVLKPKAQRIELTIGNRNLTFRVTDEEKPPQPIVRFGAQSSVKQSLAPARFFE